MYIKDNLVINLKRIPIWSYYIIISAIMIFAWATAKSWLVVQDAWLWVYKSNITLNFVLVFFIWGQVSDMIACKRGWKVGGRNNWIFFFVGLLALIFIFKYIGGYETIWG